jgi:phosphatidylglycerophosphate synthase
VLLGGLVCVELAHAKSSWIVLPAVLVACASDWGDGRLARARDDASMAGRLIDNLCDAAFLALSFAGFAVAEAWSLPLVGSATRYWEHANWLPLIGLAASFGTYMLRWAVCARRDLPLARSARGHAAGVANYVLVVIGAVSAIPGHPLTPWLLEPSFITVTLMNVTAATDNLGLLIAAVRR